MLGIKKAEKARARKGREPEFSTKQAILDRESILVNGCDLLCTISQCDDQEALGASPWRAGIGL